MVLLSNRANREFLDEVDFRYSLGQRLPGGERRGPPPGALAACSGKAPNAEWRVTVREVTVKSMCFQPETNSIKVL